MMVQPSSRTKNMAASDVLPPISATHPRSPSLQVPVPAADGCPMDNPELPPVGEMEHFVARCYCFLCNCGKHTCPAAARKRTEFLKSMYDTNYKVAYYRKNGLPGLPLRLEEYRNRSIPMDLMTIKQRDYLPFKVQPERSFKPHSALQSVQFVCRSSYQASFPNWGPTEVIRVKPLSLPYRGDQVKIEPKSTYGHDFLQPLKTSDTFEQFVKSARVGTTAVSTGPMAAGTEFYGQTTTMRNFKSLKKIPRPVIEDHHDEYLSIESPKTHFMTTYRTDFFQKRLNLRPMKKNQSQAALS